ncbi:MAG: carboxylating nicotinate-nucleotide diphosphorylase [Nannocystaceae bacterium]|nr:carboxylating nicotinate-nucleotide diphosphorylase [Nannocystaceae bacterium]
MRDLEFGEIDRVLQRAFDEDLPSTDITTVATVPADAKAKAQIVAKAPLVVCGQAIAARAFSMMDPGVRYSVVVADGASVECKTVVATLEGPARAVLAAERTALNFMQRLSGTATMVRQFADAAAGKCRVVDTRKTTPGLRALQRYAVRCGGGHNHRNDLSSGVLIKENHIRAAGGIAAAIAGAKARAPHGLRIECETLTLDEAQEAINAGAEVIMLDNMDNELCREAVARFGGKAILEASGNITIERVAALAEIGIDVISVGAFTHSAPAADLSLLFEFA